MNKILCYFQYTCLECKLFDDEDKHQYHCEGCGICRIGGRDKFFHCSKCNMCFPVKTQGRHKVSKLDNYYILVSTNYLHLLFKRGMMFLVVPSQTFTTHKILSL